MPGVAPSFIQLRDSTVIGTDGIIRMYLDGDVVVFTFEDLSVKRDSWPKGQGGSGFEYYRAQLIPGFSSGEFNMQPMFGDADSPVANPPDPTKPAFYRGRTNNTFWVWDTEEAAWFPVVSV